MKTTITQLIEKLEDIKKNNCKHVYEVVFFDGVLTVIEAGEFLETEKEQIINSFLAGQNETGPEAYKKALDYYNGKFSNN